MIWHRASSRRWLSLPSLALALAATLVPDAQAAVSGASRQLRHDEGDADVLQFNTVMGIQQVNPLYGFSPGESTLTEAARVALSMGLTAFKFALDPAKYSNTTTVLNGQPLTGPSTTLRDVARRSPEMSQVLGMPFSHLIMWTYPFATQDIVSKAMQNFTFDTAALKRVYSETYDLSVYLLTQYAGSNRTFWLGNWESDWMLTTTDSNGKRVLKHPDGAKGMIKWLQARQQAVDDAKAALQPQGVEVYHFYEVNLASRAIWDPTFPVGANLVIPFVKVDFVSLSSYDVLGPASRPQNTAQLIKALTMLEGRMGTPKTLSNFIQSGAPAPFARRVFVGEYGFKSGDGGPYTHVEAARRAAGVARAAMAWGTPLVLYWQLYNNVACVPDCGWMLVDSAGNQLPAHRLHVQFIAAARSWVSQFKASSGRLPTPQEFASVAPQLVGRW